MTLEDFMGTLASEDTAPKHSSLLQLSGLDSEQLFAFRTGWISLSTSRKRDVLTRLIDLGEDNLELDFIPIFRACLKDDEEEVREIATKGLWDTDDRVVIRPMLSLLADDTSHKVRAAATVSLAKFASLAQDGKILARDGEKIRKSLLEVISHENEDPEVRRRAIEAVASFNSPEIESLIKDAYESGDQRLRQSAIFAMGRSSNVTWLPIVLKEIGDDDPAIRYEAANAIGQLGDESIIPYLVSLTKDDDVQVQLSAVHSLGEIGGPMAKGALQQTLKMGDEILEEAAQEALASIEFDDDPLGFKFEN